MSARSREDVFPVSCFQGTRKCTILTGMEGEGNRIYRQESGRILTSLSHTPGQRGRGPAPRQSLIS